MKKFILIVTVIIMKMLVIKSSYGMSPDDDNKDKQGIIRTSPTVNQILTPQGEMITQTSIVRLEEGSSQDNIEIANISMGRKLLGYTARCGTIAGCTLIGSLIGYAIVAGEFDSTIASAVIKLGTPMVIGGSAGYVTGWVGGNLAKARINGKI